MDELTFVELLGRGGDVAHRIAVSRFPVTVGRAYDNDVIVDDPYVAPHHLRIDRDADGALRAVDLGSRNGIHVLGHPGSVQEAAITPDARIQIGHTRLRVRPRGYAVPPERAQLRWRWLQDGRALGAAAVAMAGLGVWQSYVQQFERTDTLLLLLPAALVLVLGFAWAGVWAFVGKVLTGRASYVAHACIAMLGFLGLTIVEAASGYLAFALSSRAMEHLDLVGSGVVVALMLYAHLSLVSRQSPHRLAGAAAGVAALLFAATWAWEYVQTANDLTSVAYMKHLKAPSFRLAPDHTPEEFIARAHALQREVDALRRK